jgi:hypothetical protein
MKLRSILSALLVLAILAPIPAAAAGVTQGKQRPQLQAKLHTLNPEQRKQLRTEVRTLLAQTRAQLKAGPHTRGQVRLERLKLRVALRHAVRRQIRTIR